MQSPAIAAEQDMSALHAVWTIQLGAFNTQETAENIWQETRIRHRDVLEGLSASYQRTKHKGQELYRLRVGRFIDVKPARATCQALQEKGENCYVLKQPQAQMVQDDCKNCVIEEETIIRDSHAASRLIFAGGFSVDDRELLKKEGLLPESLPKELQEELLDKSSVDTQEPIKLNNDVLPPPAPKVEVMAVDQANRKWGPHLDIELRKGNKRSIARAEAFLPLQQDATSLLFADIRGMKDSLQNHEGNIGLGYRQIISNGLGGHDWILGGYGFLDIRYSAAGNRFWQAALGVEALSEKFDFRSNVYLPQSSAKQISGTAAVNGVVVGTQLRLVGFGNVRERALPGFDAEIGYKLPILENQIDAFKLYGGGYYFDAKGYRTVAGPRGRIEMQWQNFMDISEETRFTLGFEVQNDSLRDTSAFAVARLRIPLYSTRKTSAKPRLSPIEKRMTARVIRDVDIVSAAQKSGDSIDEAAVIQVNGAQVTNVTMLDASDNVAVDVAAAGAGTTVLLDGSQGQIDLTGGIVMQPNQTIIGGGIAIAGLNSGLVGVIGTRPTVTDAGIAGVVPTIQADVVGSDLTIENIDIVSDNSGESIVIDGADNLIIRNTTTTGGTNGLKIGIGFGSSEVANALIDNVTISNTSGFGLLQIGSTVNLQDVVIDTTGSSGIATAFGSIFSANAVKISNTTQAGFFGFGAASAVLNNVEVTNAVTDSFEINATALSGSNNTSISPGASHCNDRGGNTGSFGLNGGTCP